MPSLYFDLDGTLIDVRRRHYFAYLEATGELGLTSLPEHTYWEHRLDGASNADLLDAKSAATRERFMRRWVELAESPAYLRFDTLIAGARAALTDVAASHRLVLVTLRRDRQALDEQLDDLALAKFFAAVHCHADVPQARDKAELLRLRGETVETGSLFIGDSEADIETARELGLGVVCVLSGLRGRRFLEERSPDELIASVAHLPDVLAARRSTSMSA